MSNKNRVLEGRVKVEMDGQNVERFLNISAKRNLLIEKLDQKCFFTTPNDFKEMKTVARKTRTHLKIKGRHGLPFFLYRNQKRKLLGLGLTFFIILLLISSFYIWDISFAGNYRFTDDRLLEYLEAIDVHTGIKKTDICCEELECGIRNTFSDITWVSAEIRGTRLLIRIKENEEKIKAEVSDEVPCDLIAGKSGIVKRIIVRNGFSKVKIGDVVDEGKLLVDGTIPILDDAGNLVTEHKIHADADIIAETKYDFLRKLALSRKEKVRTDRVRRGLYLRLLGHSIYLLIPSFSESLWEFILEQEQVCLFGDFCLPIYFGTINAYEYVEYERFYTEKEVKKIGEYYLTEYKEKLSEKGVQILGNDGKIEVNESGWIVTETLTVMENIAIEAQTSGKYEEN